MVQTYIVGTDGKTWKDGTTEDIKLTCDKDNQCKLDDIAKINPIDPSGETTFKEWKCDDDNVTIANDGTVTTKNSCTVYAVWE